MSIKRLVSSVAVATAISIGVVSPAVAQSSLSSSSPGNIIDAPSNVVPPVTVTPENPEQGEDSQKNEIVLNQGDRIQTRYMACTLAYVGDGFAITAAHCGSEGQEVYQSPFAGGKKIGTYDFIDTEENQDIAIIKLEDNVGGNNIYSGDRITSMAELSKDDIFCQYGMMTNEVNCGPQYGLPRFGALWSTNPVRQGDSGGPVWVEGKGLIGVISTIVEDKTGLTEAWITADKIGLNVPMAANTSDYIPK